ncbi:phosphatase 2C-like domain-containing protein [Gymnopilus junonius]|uniref:Phosphatase 2C-like domain-containing protein n=1 Tax=Gymnopilus junonius TaxID=109634 RepID=A0A9P5NV74_GYMJU|nr:phosphatase 2C-like domain-containing protein [Gymnopilus junonius]
MLQSESQSDLTASATPLRLELAQLSAASVTCGAHTVAFQPRNTKYPTEDRCLIEEWELPNGNWKFIGVFDGHGAGHEAVDFVVETLPGIIKASLTSEIEASDIILTSAIERILVQCISEVDDRIKDDFCKFFPGGPDQISKLSSDEIKTVIRDPETGYSFVQIMRARTGTTAIVAVIDPSKSLHIASLGDCDAVLGAKNDVGNWEVKTLSKRHNASNEAEANRIRSEHPDEVECIVQSRTLGLITLTRAIGDTLFKLPPIYTERILALSTPPFHENYNIGALLSRNITPPYLSNISEVEHVDLSSLSSDTTPMLILCSDGLSDLYSRRSHRSDISRDIEMWLTKSTPLGIDNLALSLLWDALGGNEGLEMASRLIKGIPGKRVDDTTVVVLQL